MKYNEVGSKLEIEIKEWSKEPSRFETDHLPYVIKQSKEHLEYAQFLFTYYMGKQEIFKAEKVILDIFRNDPISVKALELFFFLYDQCSDSPDEALWAVNLLNKIEPDLPKHQKLFDLYKQAKKDELAMQEFDNMVKKYKDNFNDIQKATAYLFSDVPKYIEKGKKLVKKLKSEDYYPNPIFVSVGSAKFYSGENYEGLIYHFGGEDFRPQNFVSKKEIPNSAKADFNGKSVVVTTYRGMGDSMILSRFIPKFLEKFPDVKLTIATEKSMVPLYKGIPNISVKDTNVCAGMMFDHCLGINMLSRYLRDQLVDKKGRINYHEWVKYPQAYDDKWKDKFPTDKPLVGCNWKGSQRLGGAPNDAEDGRNLSRDLELNDFKYIIETYPNMNFLCLNPDITSGEREWLSKQKNVYIPEKIKDFADTAALINLCDVIVSIDTSVSTLSASLSKDTIVLAKFWPDYRWLYYEKWWDLSKMNVHVFRKPTAHSEWHVPLLETIKTLRNYSK